MSEPPDTDPPVASRDIAALIDIMARLRTPGRGCAWDLAQSFATIAPFTVEEAYEGGSLSGDRLRSGGS